MPFVAIRGMFLMIDSRASQDLDTNNLGRGAEAGVEEKGNRKRPREGTT